MTPAVGRVGPVIVDSCPGVIGASTMWSLGPHATVHEFVVAPSTWRTRFRLTPDLPTSGLAITFSTSRSDTGFWGDELGVPVAGRVPYGARSAYVCLTVGSPTTFVYRAGG